MSEFLSDWLGQVGVPFRQSMCRGSLLHHPISTNTLYLWTRHKYWIYLRYYLMYPYHSHIHHSCPGGTVHRYMCVTWLCDFVLCNTKGIQHILCTPVLHKDTSAEGAVTFYPPTLGPSPHWWNISLLARQKFGAKLAYRSFWQVSKWGFWPLTH